MKNLVNADKLYSVIGNFFTDNENMLLELIQNAQRGKATKITVQTRHDTTEPFAKDTDKTKILSIKDNGQGIKDIVALLGIAISDWETDIDEQEPAGMGFLQLLALSEQIVIRSKFGELKLNSKAFLQYPAYRQQIVTTDFSKGDKYEGTEIYAVMKESSGLYVKGNYEWYTGYSDIQIVINGEKIIPNCFQARLDRAVNSKNICKTCEYKGNSLLIEIGEYLYLSPPNGNTVNWYGQLVDLCFEYKSLLRNSHVRFYYEISQGTPLTMRYPDRTAICRDEKYAEFEKFLSKQITGMLIDLFSDYEKSNKRFGRYGDYCLLYSLYQNASKRDLKKLTVYPVIKHPFANSEYQDNAIFTKDDLEGYSFCRKSIEIKEDYLLGADYDEIKCCQVDERIAPYLIDLGIPEVTEVNIVNDLDQMINLKRPLLELVFADESSKQIVLSQALLLSDCDEMYIFAENEDEVLSVFESYCEMVIQTDDERSYDEIENDLRELVIDEMSNTLNIVSNSRFNFLPKYYNLRNIEFSVGNLALKYEDGTTKKMKLKKNI